MNIQRLRSTISLTCLAIIATNAMGTATFAASFAPTQACDANAPAWTMLHQQSIGEFSIDSTVSACDDHTVATDFAQACNLETDVRSKKD